MSVKNEAREIKEEKIEEIQSILRIKQEITNSEQTTKQEQIKIKREIIEQNKIKRECLDNVCIKTENSREFTQSNSESTEEEFRTVTPQRIPNQNPNSRPQRPKRNALSLAKIASIDTQDLFTYDNSLNSDKQLSPTIKEMRNSEPQIETEIHRYPYLVNTYKSKKRQNIDSLFGKYDMGIEIFNEDGSVESCEISAETNKVSPQDTDLELVLSPPKRIRSDKTITLQTEIDEITQKYDFIQKDNSLIEFDDVVLNRSISLTEFSVRIKCGRYVYSFQMRQETPFGDTIEELAKKLEISPKQIMLTHHDETVLLTDNMLSLNLDENTILEAIILSTGFISPIKTHEPKIKIKIQFAKGLGGLVQIMAPLTADLKGILTQICESKNLTPSKFQLQFDGEPMELSNTLEHYDIEEGDVIDAIMVT